MNIEIKKQNCDYDVIIAGGGPAGCAAAIAAARQGVKVLVLETTTALGGMATVGMVSKWAPFTDKEKVIYRSIPVEILNRYKAAANIPEDKWDWINILPETLKTVYDDMLSEAGVDVRFESRVCETLTKDGNIEALIVADKSGLTAYKAHTYIDCTGDADVAYQSGVKCEKGDEYGNIQPSSLCFAIANVKMDKVPFTLSSNPNDGFWAKVKADGRFKLGCKHFIPAIIGNTIIANAGHLFEVDSTNPDEVTAALVRGRKLAGEYLDILKERLPEAFSEAFIICTSNVLGVRESRRIEGEYRLTLEDYALRRSFSDEIARNCYWLDCHGGPNTKNERINIPPEKRYYAAGESHGIPWRCLVPKGIDNLLVAGRSISMERMVLSTVRVMPNCLAMGEAAGIGAALAVKQKIGVHAINSAEVIEKIGK